MNTIKVAILTILSLFLFSCESGNKKTVDNSSELENQIQVIDFYGTHRCVTCESIEENTKHTLDTYFSNELNSGKISFLSINVDEEQNYDMAEKYEAMGTALFLNVIKDGKETHIDLTDFAFMEGTNQEAFTKQLKQKIDTELINI